MPSLVNCPNRELNKGRCHCQSKDCIRNGFCCECIAYHRQQGNLPMCLRSAR
ncbi:MAG: hypothetical protein LBQ76_03330 [Candidatus Fibromonas sp.]|nr:hypothetical protein [Candidatus Fibromonas sp.]